MLKNNINIATDVPVNDEPDNLPEFIPVAHKKRPNRIILGVICALCTAAIAISVILLLSCLLPKTPSSNTDITYTSADDLSLDTKNWLYDETSSTYYQLGVVYTAKPVDNQYNSLGIFVPKDFLDCTKNNSHYTCTVNESQEVNGYTSATAPVVFPVDTPNYSAQKTPTNIPENAKYYLQKGFIYIQAGMRGADIENASYETTAPWGVADAKSAIRYLRYNSTKLPGDFSKIIAFGSSEGATQSAVLGASGDSSLYTPYLESLGALQSDPQGNALSDSIFAVATWNPNVNFPAVATENYILNIVNKALNNYLTDHFTTKAEKKDYILSLNGQAPWISFKKGVANIADLSTFAAHRLPHSNHRSAPEDISSPAHFIAENSSTIAPYWRIRSNLGYTATSPADEIDFALALKQNIKSADAQVKAFSFTTVWTDPSTPIENQPAERIGTASENFSTWVELITK